MSPATPLQQAHSCSALMGTCGEAHSLAPGDPCPQVAGPLSLWPRCRPWGSTKLCLLPPPPQYSSQCVPGCVCPHGLVANGDGGCIPVSDCPCVHNEASYQPGQIIRVGCNTWYGEGLGPHLGEGSLQREVQPSRQVLPPPRQAAGPLGGRLGPDACRPCPSTCKSRMWQCTDQPCPATCAVYGDGHYLTFDGQRYSFSGDCEYTLLQVCGCRALPPPRRPAVLPRGARSVPPRPPQDHCGGNGSAQDGFRVITENVPCGTTGTTCSKAIKIFLGVSSGRGAWRGAPRKAALPWPSRDRGRRAMDPFDR